MAAAPAGPDTRPPSFPQRRNLHRKNVQEIKQITTKCTLSDGCLQVTVSGSDHPRIGLDGASSTDTFEFVFLQNTQASDLSLGRKPSDFIEEDLPPLANSKWPKRYWVTPVKAPCSWPNNSEAIKSRCIAAQFTLTNAREDRR